MLNRWLEFLKMDPAKTVFFWNYWSLNAETKLCRANTGIKFNSPENSFGDNSIIGRLSQLQFQR